MYLLLKMLIYSIVMLVFGGDTGVENNGWFAPHVFVMFFLGENIHIIAKDPEETKLPEQTDEPREDVPHIFCSRMVGVCSCCC